MKSSLTSTYTEKGLEEDKGQLYQTSMIVEIIPQNTQTENKSKNIMFLIV